MKSRDELKKIGDSLLPIQRLFFKHGKGWMLDSLAGLSKEEYEELEKIVKEGEKW